MFESLPTAHDAKMTARASEQLRKQRELNNFNTALENAIIDAMEAGKTYTSMWLFSRRDKVPEKDRWHASVEDAEETAQKLRAMGYEVEVHNSTPPTIYVWW